MLEKRRKARDSITSKSSPELHAVPKKSRLKALFRGILRVPSNSKRYDCQPVAAVLPSPDKGVDKSVDRSAANSSVSSNKSIPTAIKNNENLRRLLHGSTATPIAQTSYTNSEFNESRDSLSKEPSSLMSDYGSSPLTEGLSRSMSALNIGGGEGQKLRDLFVRRANSMNTQNTPVARIRHLSARTEPMIPEVAENGAFENYELPVESPAVEQLPYDGVGSTDDLFSTSITPHAADNMTSSTPSDGPSVPNTVLQRNTSTGSMLGKISGRLRPRSGHNATTNTPTSIYATTSRQGSFTAPGSNNASMLSRRDTMDSQTKAPTQKRRRFSNASSYKNGQQATASGAHSEAVEREKLARFQARCKVYEGLTAMVVDNSDGLYAIIIDATMDGKPYSKFSRAVTKYFCIEALLEKAVAEARLNPFAKVAEMNLQESGIYFIAALVREPWDLTQRNSVVLARSGYSATITRGIQLGLNELMMGACFSQSDGLERDLAEAFLRTVFFEINSNELQQLYVNVFARNTADFEVLMEVRQKIEHEKACLVQRSNSLGSNA
ncbi:unnamed protein product, partial [Mesorhabditis spiculigera]